MSLTLLSGVVTGMPGEMAAGLERIAHVAAPLAVTAVWQGLAVALALAAALRLAPRISAGQRFAVWAIGFGAVAVLPLAPLLGRIGSVPASVSATSSATHQPWLELAPAWSVAIALLWAAASLLRAVDLGVHGVRLRRIWKSAVPVDWPIELDGRHAAQVSPRSVQVCSTTELDRPSVIGFLAPRILVPAWLLEKLTPDDLEQVVLHEAEHLRRRDDWTNLLQKIALVLFPLNPALWWMEQRLCREREMACDEGVVRQTRAPRAYAACLASLAERGLARRTEALTLGAWKHRPELVDRVHRILKRSPEMSPLATGAFLAVLAGGLIAGSVELTRCPELVAFDAQQPLTTAMDAAIARPASAAVPAALEASAVSLTHPSPQKRRARAAAGMALMRQTETPETDARLNGQVQEPRAVATRAVMPQAIRNVNGAGAQYFVVAAWEQVQIVDSTQQIGSDYDVVAQPDAPIPAPRVEQFTVTRLIFRVVPRVQIQAAQPAVREGWLALQL